MLYQTPRKQVGNSWIDATFGTHKIGSQKPYCSLTGTEWSNANGITDRSFVSGGQNTALVLRAFPSLAPFAQFHLATDGEPLHYVSNARYWYEIATFARAGQPHEHQAAPAHFASTILHGAIEERYTVEQLLGMDWPSLLVVLALRLPLLQARWAMVLEMLPQLVVELGATEVRE